MELPISPPIIDVPTSSLSKSLTRRVQLLGFIGVIGLVCIIALGTVMTYHLVQTRFDNASHEATGVFDRFFLDIQSDLKATSDSLATHPDKNSTLLALTTRNRAFLNVLVLNPDGVILAQRNTLGHLRQTKIEQPEWLKPLPPVGTVVIGPVRFEGETPCVDMAVTVTDDISLPAGLLLVRVDLTALWDTALDIKVGKTGYAYITDSSGQLVVSRNRRLLETGSNLKKLVGRTPQAIVASHLGYYTGLNRQLVLASAQPLKTVPWFAVVEQPVFEIFTPVLLLVIFLLTIIIAVGLILNNTIRFTQTRVVSPLLELRNVVGQIADGDLSKTVEWHNDDELGQLSRSVNRMAVQLHQSFDELENTIGELQQSQTRLKESEAFRRRVFDSSRTPIVIMDATTHAFVDCNPAAVLIYGYSSREEVVGKSPADVSAPVQYDGSPSQEKAALFIEKAMAEGSDIFEWRHQHPDGGIWDAEVFLMSFQLHGHSYLQFTLQDITERKLADEMLQKLYQTVNQCPASIAITDLSGDLEYVNPAFCALTGYTAAEVLGMNPRILKSGMTSQAEYQRLWETVKGGGTWSGEFCNTKKNGDLYWERATIAPITDSEGAIKFYVAIKEDITKQKQAETENTKLESQLQQAQKMESVGRLAGGVAHDFNNILTAITGYTELSLMKSDLTQPIRSNLEEIRTAADRAADLTRQLLAFARRQTIEPKVLNLNETVSGMLKMIQRLIGENIQLNWVAGIHLWPVKVDPSQIDQLLANLCVNSRDAIADVGKITIETDNCSVGADYCAYHVDASPGDYVRLVVSDTGSGMDNDTLSHIFEPFFTTKGVGEGTGLGLSTVFGIIKQNNGFLTVCSEQGVGTTFTVHLPRYVGILEQLPTKTAADPVPHGHETILLVEDDKAILNLAADILSNLDYSVLQAGSPSEALRMAKENNHEINLLMTDVIMPEMNGKDLADTLKSFIPQLKCLFMSGYTANVISHHGVLDEGVHFIQKPFSPSKMAVKIREVLDGNSD